MKRLFVAIELPDSIKDKLTTVEKELKAELNGNFVDREKLHITFLFLGDTTISTENIISSIKSISIRELRIEISGLGVFPSLKRPRVIFANVVTDLREQYNSLCNSLGLKPEGSFSPHITLCRLQGKSDNIKSIIDNYANINLTFSQEKLALFNSDFRNYYKIY